MAVNTPAHREWFDLLDDFHISDITVALLTINASSDVPLMVKVGVICNFVNPNPLDWLAFVPRFFDLLNLRTVCLHNTVTIHANIQTGYRCMRRFFDTRMAVHTRDLILTSVQLMTEWNGLLRRIPHISGRRCQQIDNSSC